MCQRHSGRSIAWRAGSGIANNGEEKLMESETTEWLKERLKLFENPSSLVREELWISRQTLGSATCGNSPRQPHKKKGRDCHRPSCRPRVERRGIECKDGLPIAAFPKRRGQKTFF